MGAGLRGVSKNFGWGGSGGYSGCLWFLASGTLKIFNLNFLVPSLPNPPRPTNEVGPKRRTWHAHFVQMFPAVARNSNSKLMIPCSSTRLLCTGKVETGASHGARPVRRWCWGQTVILIWSPNAIWKRKIKPKIAPNQGTSIGDAVWTSTTKRSIDGVLYLLGIRKIKVRIYLV